MFVAEPEHSALPKKAKAGDVLTGSITYATADEKLLGAGKRPRGFPVTYTVPPAPSKEEEKKAAEAPETRTELEKMEDAIRDLTVKKLKDTAGKDGFDEIYAVAKDKYPDHLPVLQAYLKHVDTAVNRGKDQAGIVAAASAVIAMIDGPQLASHFSTNVDKDDLQAVKLRKEMTTKKEALIATLASKARALRHAEAQAADEPKPDGAPNADAAGGGAADAATATETFEAVLKELKKWDTVDATNHLHLSLESDFRTQRFGCLLKSVQAAIDKAGGIADSELKRYKAEAYAGLGWAHAAAENKMWEVLSAPADYPLYG